MSELIVNMIGHNEANRFLTQVLKHTFQFTDTIVFTDDHSTDETAEIANSLGCHVYSVDDPEITFTQNEAWLRAEAWSNMENHVKNPYDTYVLLLDCDEILWRYTMLPALMDMRHHEVIGIPFYHIWQPPHLARIDKAWAPTISSRLFRYYPGGEYRPRRLACGEPTYVEQLIRQGKILWKTPLLFEHLGYVHNEDKAMKYKRYMELDGGEFHNLNHIESIMDPTPILIDISNLCVP